MGANVLALFLLPLSKIPSGRSKDALGLWPNFDLSDQLNFL